MAYWLIKSEPDVYSYTKLVEEKEGTWDGVRNYQARNNLKLMEKGDLALFYHSNIGLEVVGIAQISQPWFQDPTTDNTNWVAVKVKPFKALNKPVSLQTIKQQPLLQNIALVRNGRLSVMPLSAEEFNCILKQSETHV